MQRFFDIYVVLKLAKHKLGHQRNHLIGIYSQVVAITADIEGGLI